MDSTKKGFISMTVVYSFLLIFLIIILSILGIYMQKSRLVDNIVIEVKAELE